jgi:hypothetical protein
MAVTIDGKTRDHVTAFSAADEIEVNLGSLDAPDRLMPTYESRIIRRESWLPPFPLTRRYDRDRDTRVALSSRSLEQCEGAVTG